MKALSLETREKIRKALRGKPFTLERRMNISKALTGRKMSEECKEKIRLSMLGKPKSLLHRLHIAWAQTGVARPPLSSEWKLKISLAGRGLKRSVETRRRLSEAHSGENNHFWKGGITPLHRRLRQTSKYAEWRTAVYERDDYTCQQCGQKGGRLNADHVKSFSDHPELRCILSNGRTLCESCHRKTDTFGWKSGWLRNKETRREALRRAWVYRRNGTAGGLAALLAER